MSEPIEDLAGDPLEQERAGMLAAFEDPQADVQLRARGVGFAVAQRENDGAAVFAVVSRTMKMDLPLELVIAIAEAAGDAGVDAESLVPDFVAWLDAPRPEVRYWATYALGRLGPSARIAAPRLEALAQSEFDGPKYGAISALRLLGLR
ncbi:MAG: hypothetical protein MUE69_32790 [Myxococcota bacterium]|jgi:hypothetical protein|nr:hypothetical protein [Myxococcota bacterium]